MANLKYKKNNNEWKSILSTRGPKGDNADITLNGTTLGSASFYAPISSGLAGQVLISKGANQSPQWNNLAIVAGTGSYTDLIDKPTIPTTTDELISGSTKVLTSGGAYNAFSQRGIPAGGTAGQVIKKGSATDFDFAWGDACIDNLTSTSITTPLSANQGKVLNEKFGNYLLKTSNAVSATKAVQDGNGNNIVNTYATKTEMSSKTEGTFTAFNMSSGFSSYDEQSYAVPGYKIINGVMYLQGLINVESATSSDVVICTFNSSDAPAVRRYFVVASSSGETNNGSKASLLTIRPDGTIHNHNSTLQGWVSLDGTCIIL